MPPIRSTALVLAALANVAVHALVLPATSQLQKLEKEQSDELAAWRDFGHIQISETVESASWMGAALYDATHSGTTSKGSEEEHTKRFPTVAESARLARAILRNESTGVMSTIFPSRQSDSRSGTDGQTADTTPAQQHLHAWENRPDDVAGLPVGLMDYIADCDPNQETGNPTILAIGIATTFKNVEQGSNVSLAIQSHPAPHALGARSTGHWDSPAAHARFSLIGYIERIPEDEVQDSGVEKCFLSYHPDAHLWLPGNRIHESWWARLVVQQVYWIGGFGDTNYIGWIPKNVWVDAGKEL